MKKVFNNTVAILLKNFWCEDLSLVRENVVKESFANELHLFIVITFASTLLVFRSWYCKQ